VSGILSLILSRRQMVRAMVSVVVRGIDAGVDAARNLADLGARNRSVRDVDVRGKPAALELGTWHKAVGFG
jgi:hypothetical protein